MVLIDAPHFEVKLTVSGAPHIPNMGRHVIGLTMTSELPAQAEAFASCEDLGYTGYRLSKCQIGEEILLRKEIIP